MQDFNLSFSKILSVTVPQLPPWNSAHRWTCSEFGRNTWVERKPKQLLSARKKINLFRVSAYVRICENEKADQEPKTAAQQTSNALFPLPHSDTKLIIKKFMRLKTKSNGDSSQHGYLMAEEDQPKCETCQEPLSVIHAVESYVEYHCNPVISISYYYILQILCTFISLSHMYLHIYIYI